MDARNPQRFKFRYGTDRPWCFGVCFPIPPNSFGDRWSIETSPFIVDDEPVAPGAGFYSDPWEVMGHVVGDVESFVWIDNDHGWLGTEASCERSSR